MGIPPIGKVVTLIITKNMDSGPKTPTGAR